MKRAIALAGLVLSLTGCYQSNKAGSYGAALCEEGEIIANLCIHNTKRDDNMNGTPVDDPLRTTCLSDYQEDPSLKVLGILVAAEWCQPCRIEQGPVVEAYRGWKAAGRGVAIIEAITQKQDGTPSVERTIDDWASYYHVPFDITTDRRSALGSCSNPMLFPSQLVIRLSDMSIQWRHDGYVEGEFEEAVNAVLAQ